MTGFALTRQAALQVDDQILRRVEVRRRRPILPWWRWLRTAPKALLVLDLQGIALCIELELQVGPARAGGERIVSDEQASRWLATLLHSPSRVGRAKQHDPFDVGLVAERRV